MFLSFLINSIRFKEAIKHIHNWQKRRMIWPYPHGYAWVCTKCGMIDYISYDEDELDRFA